MQEAVWGDFQNGKVEHFQEEKGTQLRQLLHATTYNSESMAFIRNQFFTTG